MTIYNLLPYIQRKMEWLESMPVTHNEIGNILMEIRFGENLSKTLALQLVYWYDTEFDDDPKRWVLEPAFTQLPHYQEVLRRLRIPTIFMFAYYFEGDAATVSPQVIDRLVHILRVLRGVVEEITSGTYTTRHLVEEDTTDTKYNRDIVYIQSAVRKYQAKKRAYKERKNRYETAVKSMYHGSPHIPKNVMKKIASQMYPGFMNYK